MPKYTSAWRRHLPSKWYIISTPAQFSFTIDGTGADGARSEGGKRILLDNSRVYVRFHPFVGGRLHLGRMDTGRGMLGSPLEPRETPTPRPQVSTKTGQNPKPRVSATIPSRWTITPLFYSQSTDLPVLRGRPYVDGATERPQTGGLYNKFMFPAL